MPSKISREDLIAELNRLADELDKVPTREEMNEHGQYSRTPYDTEFGGWNEALRAAGFDLNKPDKLSRKELKEELERLADEINRTPRKKDMNEKGRYSVRAYLREWDGWNEALVDSGFEVNKPHGVEYPTLICEHCNEEYEVKPAKKELSRYCSDECKNKAKTKWVGENNPHPNSGKRITKQCEWCGNEFETYLSEKNTARFCSRQCLGNHHREVRSGKDSPRWRGGYEPYYGPNWRDQRRRAKERDDYTCQRCGATNNLVVHHKTAFREFAKEEPVDYEAAHSLDNLVTLCRECHAKVENGASNGFGGD